VWRKKWSYWRFNDKTGKLERAMMPGCFRCHRCKVLCDKDGVKVDGATG